ncbi:MAG: hypothetical protein ACKVHO_07105 [Verrucomicrobiia bacterium]|jgi:hypothetical protein
MDRFQTRLSEMYSRADIQVFGNAVSGSETKFADDVPQNVPPISNQGMNYRPRRAS